MKFRIKIKRDEVWDGLYLRGYVLLKENKRSWASAVGLFGLGGGFLAPIIGAFLNLTDLLTNTGAAHSRLYNLSMIFYAITLPLLALGAHCLDLLEKKYPLPVAEKLKTDKMNLGLKA